MTGEFEHLYRIGLALAIGFVIGAERGWNSRTQESGSRTAGIRTFTLIGLLAGISAELSDTLTYAVPVVAFLGVLILAAAGYMLGIRQGDPDIGLTTEVAMLLTFALGTYAVLGDPTIAASAAVVTVGLLRLKPELHRLLAAIDRLELNSAIRLLIISVVILPLLPDRGFGPGAVVNPYEIWWMIVLISALSFAGYVALKLAGPRRGPILGGLLGGLASSTAVTLSFARMVQRDRTLAASLAVGVELACAIMFVRVIVIAGVVNPALARQLALPFGVMAALLVLVILVSLRSPDKETHPFAVEIRDPSDIPAALKFGVFLLGIVLLSHYLERAFGAHGIYALALAAGLADVDAITLTLARNSTASGQYAGQYHVAAGAITLAAIANTAVKAAIAALIGGPAFARRIVPALGGAVVIGIVLFAWARMS